MRRILLATAALAVLGTTAAFASDSQGVAIQATVTASCSLTDPSDVTFPNNPLPGATANRTFSFTCNFAGTNTNTLFLGLASANGGLNNPGDPDSAREYKVTYAATDYLASAIGVTPASIAETSGAPGVANNRSFDVTLVDSLDVAGLYQDTLTVSIAP